MSVSIGKPPRRGIKMVESPDDGGVYLESYDLDTNEEGVSILYPNKKAAIDAMRRNDVEWEKD